ncbi:hypothetical protein [Albimonas donghaensis]|uniref:hypothetical protein n=1 Tax=Albimonas donghaensis TaxID=356660 RepID=UPI00115F8530|nr:hypothetical protein [Albimonas donghaensis]
MFFVISGFLIISLIAREKAATGRFPIADFHERRARRLLPALFVVIFASLPFAWTLRCRARCSTMPHRFRPRCSSSRTCTGLAR